jgi:hypothetical protein
LPFDHTSEELPPMRFCYAISSVLVRMAASSQRTILGIESDSRGVVPHRKEVRYARLGALHEAVRLRAFFRLEQAAPWPGYPYDFFGDYSADFNEVDFGSELFCWRLDFSFSWTQDRRKPSGVFSRTNLFARRTNLGRKGSMGVPRWNTPFIRFKGRLRRYRARYNNQAVVSDLGVRPKL